MKPTTPTVLLLVHAGWLLCGPSLAWLVQEPPGGVDPLPNRLEGEVVIFEGVDSVLNRKEGVGEPSGSVDPKSGRTKTEGVIEATRVNETRKTLTSLTSVNDFGDDLFDVDNKGPTEGRNPIFENVKRRRRRREVQAAPVTYRRREEEEGIYISYNELGEVDRFSSGSVKSFRNLLFDPANYQLIVGARDHLYRLSLTGFHLLESASWAPDLDTVRMCEIKGQDAYHCHNFVTLLEKHDGRLLACGTNAFRPLCSWRSLTSISTIEELFKGVSQSPFDPDLTSTHLMAGDGSLFVGTTNDFHGRDPAFMRLEGSQSWLRTAQNDYKWLSQPSFVSSFETGGFVYFFFRENAVEYLNCGERVYPRIGRICKDDPGGSGGHAEKWTTFLKARLDCSVPGGPAAFHYDSLQSIAFLPAEDVFYGLFTTQENGVAGSALCSFNMTSVNKSFDGPFKYQSGPSAAWTPVYDNLDHYKCQYGDIGSDPSLLSKASVNSNKYQLMDTDVHPVHPDPVYTIDHERLTHIAVDVVPTRQSGPVHVLYVAGEDATIRKISVVPGSSRTAVSNRNTSTTCLLEVIAPFPRNATAKIHTLKFLRETHSLYIGTETEVVRVPVHRCQRYGSRSACLAAQDPYCGWDRDLLECSPPPELNPFDSSWVQEVIDCPTNTEPFDGRWSPWGPWESCRQSESSDGCQCRHRTCDAPAPTRGGEYCEGHTTEVSNCTVHGGWTAWSAWSQCSATCGVAVKTRRRTCTNPAPQHGGRVCVGLDHNEIYCHLLPPCPVSTHLPVPGGWGSWSKWSNCSAQCGEGVQRRARLCNNPRPKHGGALCPGCDEQTEPCQGTRCASVQEYSSWTPWLVSTDLEIDGLQKRYRVQCSATAGIHPELSVDMSHEERFCPDGESCTTTAVLRSGGLWEEWNEWSACDRECGTGQQSRWRACASSDCDGRSTQHRACNTHPCKGDWNCWSDWGACTPSCGDGVQKRTRVCLASRSPRLEASDCAGERVDERPCQGPDCYIPPGEEGWSPWSVWSSCVSTEQFRARTRVCASQDPSRCRGLDQQKEACLKVMEPPDVTLLESHRSEPRSHAQISVGSLAGACLACLLLGIIVGALSVHAYYVRQRHHQVPSSPHYLSVKPNQYVTVPGAQWKITTKAERDKSVPKGQQLPMTPTATLKHSLKRQGSVRDPYTTLPLKDIDTATIKRSSHSSYSNGHLRADLDSDTIFNF